MDARITTIDRCWSEGEIAVYPVTDDSRIVIERCWGAVTLTDDVTRCGSFFAVNRQVRGNARAPWETVATLGAVGDEAEARRRAEMVQTAESGPPVARDA